MDFGSTDWSPSSGVAARAIKSSLSMCMLMKCNETNGASANWSDVFCQPKIHKTFQKKQQKPQKACEAFNFFKTKQQGQREISGEFHINSFIWGWVPWGRAKRRKCHLSALVYSSQLLISCKTLRRNHDGWLLCTIRLPQFYSRHQKIYWILPEKEAACNNPCLGRINNILNGGRKAPYLLIVWKTVKSIGI